MSTDYEQVSEPPSGLSVLNPQSSVLSPNSALSTESSVLSPPSSVLILGLGNILLRDEGVGVRIVEALARMTLPPGVEVFDGATAGFDLLEVLADRPKVIVVDAMEGDAEPGAVWRLTPEDLLPQAGERMSLHEVGLLEVLTSARRLGVAPPEVVIIGVKPYDVSCGVELTPGMERLVPQIIQRVLAELPRGAGVHH